MERFRSFFLARAPPSLARPSFRLPEALSLPLSRALPPSLPRVPFFSRPYPLIPPFPLPYDTC